MHARTRTLARLALGLVMLAWVGLVVVLFYLPHVVAYWQEAGGELSPTQRLAVRLASLVDHGPLAVGLLVVATVAALFWRLVPRR